MQKEEPLTAISVVCFGEVLWDVFPDKVKLGGAPLNAAYNMRKLGAKCQMISRVGNDDLGQQLLAELQAKGMSTQLIDIDENYPTSTVDLFVDEHNEVKYTINEGVAWDYIPLETKYLQAVAAADVFVFGTLALRNETSYQTLLKLLDVAKVKILDINVRLPHFPVQRVMDILPKIDILKLNEAELNFIIEALGVDMAADEHLRSRFLQQHFGIQEIVLTKGSKGAIYYRDTEQLYYPTYKIEVNDTVGSGDAFLAGFVMSRFDANTATDMTAIMDKATAVGAFITTQEGACPDYSLEQLQLFHSTHQTTINQQI